MNRQRNETDFINQCKAVDFSKESANRDENLLRLKSRLQTLNEEREIYMKRKLQKTMVIAAAMAAVMCFSIAVYGQSIFKVIKTITLGQYAKYTQIEDTRKFIPVPAGLEGKLFYEDGSTVMEFPPTGPLYNADGVEVQVYFDGTSAQIATMDEFAKMAEDSARNKFETTDLKVAKSLFVAESLTPSYMPQGYAFQSAKFYGGNTQEAIKADERAGKFMETVYSNGTNQITINVRYMDGDIVVETTLLGDIKKVQVNGYAAVISDKTLDVQIGDIMYSITGNTSVNSDELVRIAESLK